MINANGSNLRRFRQPGITGFDVLRDIEPAWSLDGSRIAFSSSQDHGILGFGSSWDDYDVFVMQEDGSNSIRLTDNDVDDNQPAWSPDGTKIAFQTLRDGNWEIYTMNMDGRNPERLTNNSAIDVDPAWSPDGTKIAFTSNRDGNMEIYVMDSDGTNPIRMTNHFAADRRPDWFPGGSKIVFVSDRDGNYEVYVGVLGEPNTGPVVTSVEVAPSRVPQGEMITVRASGTTLSE